MWNDYWTRGSQKSWILVVTLYVECLTQCLSQSRCSRRLLPPLAVLKERIQVLLFPPTLSSCGPGLGWVGKGVLQAAEYDEGAAAPAFPHWSCNSISDGVRRDLSWGHVHAPNTAWSLSTCLLRAPVAATSASPGSLWETQNLGSHSGSPPPESAF